MLSVTIATLLGSREALRRLHKERIAPHAAFRLKRLIEVANGALDHFSAEHLALLKEYGHQPTEDYWEPKPEHLAEFTPLFQKLLAEEVEFPVNPITLADLGKATISAEDLAALGWLIIEA